MELWRDIPGYVGAYQVSDDGNVRSLCRLLASATNAGIRKPKKNLKFGKNNQGRLQVALCANGEVKRFQVHRLVLLAFDGPCPDGMEGCHNDGNHTNNRISNLRWGTRSSNRDDARQHGTMPMGESHKRHKLTEQDVRDIRASDGTEREIAAQYGVSQVTIHFIKKRKTWKHI
jgi:hypothetical protein